VRQEEFGPAGYAGINVGMEPIVGRVVPGSPAEAKGIRAGDRILRANGVAIEGMQDVAAVADKTPPKPLTLDVVRGSQALTFTIPPTADPKLGPLRGIVPPTNVTKLSFFPALRYSVKENWRMLKIAFAAIGRLFRPEGSVKELSGPVNIARISGEVLRRGWLETISLMAMISLQLGIMNLLPIPVLDGGHIMILLIEGIARRDLSLRVKERIQQVGFAALAMLMLVVIYNDVISNVLRVRGG
jgi:regulator of sigma E protease